MLNFYRAPLGYIPCLQAKSTIQTHWTLITTTILWSATCPWTLVRQFLSYARTSQPINRLKTAKRQFLVKKGSKVSRKANIKGTSSVFVSGTIRKAAHRASTTPSTTMLTSCRTTSGSRSSVDPRVSLGLEIQENKVFWVRAGIFQIYNQSIWVVILLESAEHVCVCECVCFLKQISSQRQSDTLYQ